jgi:hypothetical protein
MTSRIHRSITEPVRTGLSWDECWKGDDGGLIISWEVGRQLRQQQPDLAAQAERGELPPLDWKGGVEKPRKSKAPKYAGHFYLAMWQGLRGEDLDVDPSVETQMVCARTGVKVIYTNDLAKYGKEG